MKHGRVGHGAIANDDLLPTVSSTERCVQGHVKNMERFKQEILIMKALHRFSSCLLAGVSHSFGVP